MRTIQLLAVLNRVEVKDNFNILRVTVLSATEDWITYERPFEVFKGKKTPITSLAISKEYYDRVINQEPMYAGRILAITCDERVLGKTQYIDKDKNVQTHGVKRIAKEERHVGDTQYAPSFIAEGNVEIYRDSSLSERMVDKLVETSERMAKAYNELNLLTF